MGCFQLKTSEIYKLIQYLIFFFFLQMSSFSSVDQDIMHLILVLKGLLRLIKSINGSTADKAEAKSHMFASTFYTWKESLHCITIFLCPIYTFLNNK